MITKNIWSRFPLNPLKPASSFSNCASAISTVTSVLLPQKMIVKNLSVFDLNGWWNTRQTTTYFIGPIHFVRMLIFYGVSKGRNVFIHPISPRDLWLVVWQMWAKRPSRDRLKCKYFTLVEVNMTFYRALIWLSLMWVYLRTNGVLRAERFYLTLTKSNSMTEWGTSLNRSSKKVSVLSSVALAHALIKGHAR